MRGIRSIPSEQMAYRMLKMHIDSAMHECWMKVIAFTSVEHCKEKWAYICNVAKLMALEGGKVLVIDCNIDSLRTKKYFGMEFEESLSKMTHNEGENIFEVAEIPMLHFIPQGLGLHDMEGNLDFDKIIGLIENSRAEYDFVLIDTPPAGITAEGVRLSSIADGTIITVLSNKTQKNLAKRTKDVLDTVNANVLGVILGA